MLLSFTLGLFITSCSTEDEVLPENSIEEQSQLNIQDSDKFLSIEEINRLIDQSFYEKQSFSWEGVPANVLWSAAVHGSKMITIGYGEKGESYREDKDQRLEDLRNTLVEDIMKIEGYASQILKLKQMRLLMW